MNYRIPRFTLFLIGALIPLAGCGVDFTTAKPGSYTRTVTTVTKSDVVGGKVYSPGQGVTVAAVSACGQADKKLVSPGGDFAVAGVTCTDGTVVASLSDNTQLYSFLTGYPQASTDVILTSKDNWYNQTSDTVDVKGNTTPVTVSQLTDIAYRAGDKAVNNFLNRYAVPPAACGPTMDYKANPVEAYKKIKKAVLFLADQSVVSDPLLLDCSTSGTAPFATIVADVGAPFVNDILNGYFKTTAVDYGNNSTGTLADILAAVDQLLVSPGPSDYKRYLQSVSFAIGKKKLNDFLNAQFGPAGASYDYVANPPTAEAVAAAAVWLATQ